MLCSSFSSLPPYNDKKHRARNVRKGTSGFYYIPFFSLPVPLPPKDKLLVLKSTSFTTTFSQLFGLNYVQPNRRDFEKNVYQPQFDLYESISFQIFLDCRGFVCICVQESNNMCPRLSPLPISPNTPS